MADRTFTLDIVTPDRVVVRDTATALFAPGVLGSFGVLPNHAPMLAELKTGELRFRRDTGREERLALSGGFLQIFDNSVTVLADSAERAEEIDVDRARRALETAPAMARHTTPDVDPAARQAAQEEQERALNRMRVARMRER